MKTVSGKKKKNIFICAFLQYIEEEEKLFSQNEPVVEFFAEFAMMRNIEHDAIFVAQPVEIAPHFAADHALRSLSSWQATHRTQEPEQHPNVRVVLVGRIVRIDDFRSRCKQNFQNFQLERFVARVFDLTEQTPQKHTKTKTKQKTATTLYIEITSHFCATYSLRNCSCHMTLNLPTSAALSCSCSRTRRMSSSANGAKKKNGFFRCVASV